MCRDVWFMFPKERYQYSEQINDSQQENNLGAQMSTDAKMSRVEAADDFGHQAMDLADDCDSLAGNSLDTSNEHEHDHENIDDVIFLSTFKEEPQPSSDDDEPIYDDED